MLLQTKLTKKWILLFLSLVSCLALATEVDAQTEVNGAFEGHVTNIQTGEPIGGATVTFTELSSNVELPPRRTDENGYFYQGMLPPGLYRIRAEKAGFKPREERRLLQATLINRVVPVPMPLEPEAPVATASPTPVPPAPAATPGTSTSASIVQATSDDRDVESRSVTIGSRRGGGFTSAEVETLPLGSITLTRTFDELALLLPGVALPPQTLGSVTGPGIGPGVGTAGQFSVNGLRSRSNNFTVDGSDNNDEDVGVRRQGFLALIPQPIESIQEYQLITLLAPAQFGRNIGAQVNAISKAGSKSTHGTVFGFLNSSQLNARNSFDTANGEAVSPLLSGTEPFLFTGIPSGNQRVLLNGSPLNVQNQSGGKDSSTLGQFGFVLGGPIKQNRTFYFVSGERQILNASKETNFVVPTVAQRGAFNTGASGIFLDPFGHTDPTFTFVVDPAFGFPTSRGGDAIFSLYPFPNNPNGIYGVNTLTQSLPASGRGLILSGRLDHNFEFRDKPASMTGRYNFTDDRRDIPAIGGAIFSSVRAKVKTQNFSFFFNNELTDPNSVQPIFNQLRFSYGRTNLNFNELRSDFLLPSRFANTPFMLNARLIGNFTLPAFAGDGGQNVGDVIYRTEPSFPTIEDVLGPVGQIDIKSFSPVGVDVNFFPQRRTNNTYQLADILTWHTTSGHNLTFGTDLRRTGLNSDLPRNFRPLFTFGGLPWTDVIADSPSFRTLNPRADFESFFTFLYRPEDLAAAGAATSITQTLATSDADPKVNLHYFQFAFFGQDEWRVNRKLSLSFGLRYELNTPFSDSNNRIENGLAALSSLVPGLQNFLGERTQIYDSDRNNFAPRVGLAFAPSLFGPNHSTVLRTGFGIFYDQIPGAIVSQSRGVFPDFLTVNLPGGTPNVDTRNTYTLDAIRSHPGLVQPGTSVLNTLNSATSLAEKLTILQSICTAGGAFPQSGCFELTLPAQDLQMPMAYHYHLTLEQQLGANTFISAAYVGTKADHLLRFATPNLGPNSLILPTLFLGAGDPLLANGDPKQQFQGIALSPGTRIENGLLVGGRPIGDLGAVNVFQTTAKSHYDSLQLQLRGRFSSNINYQVAYTFSKSIDDASDFFGLAGAPAAPQNSLTFAGERALSNFDAPHRFAYSFIWDFSSGGSGAWASFSKGLQIASTGQFQSGQPFTVNSLFDINVDGNHSDRLNTTDGITVTGDRRRPLILTNPNTFDITAPYFEDGSVPRNTFRSGNVLDLNLAFLKRFSISESQSLTFRAEIFNFINRANFGVPVRFLEAVGFGQAINTVTPARRIQFALKYAF